MYNGLQRAKKKVIREMTWQGKQYSEQEAFFEEFWKAMRESFSEENNTSSATFVLERYLKVLPLDKIWKSAFIATIEEAYAKRGL